MPTERERELSRERNQRYRAKHRDKIRARNRDFANAKYASNPEAARQRLRDYRNSNREQVRAWDRKGYRRHRDEICARKSKWNHEHRAQKRTEEKRRSRQRLADPQHALRHKARTAVGKAVRAGKMTRPDRCSNCGAKRRIEAHHHRGYEPPYTLDVIWLCRPCHVIADGRRKVSISQPALF